MSTHKYLCMYRGISAEETQSRPSPAQMQEMFSAFNEWKEKFKPSILDLGSKLTSSGRVVTATGVTDGPFAEGKEIVGGFMIIAANDYDDAVAIVQAMPTMRMPGARVEIREMGSM